MFRFDISSNKISQGIISSIAELGRKGKFEDFEVIVEGERIKCHSFLLASCSEFFRNLLDSNMKEKQDMKVDLPNVTSKTFKLILNSLYTGEELLTNDNVLEVWSAVHMLQIRFLIQHCEDFIVDNVTIETIPEYKKQAEHFHYQRFTERVLPFMCKNFMSFRKTESFLQLDFKDLMKLIESDQMKVCSEDLVLYSIYDWVSHGKSITIQGIDKNNLRTVSKADDANGNSENISSSNQKELNIKGDAEDSPLISSQNQANERALYLHPLLKGSRYLLASDDCIRRLLMNTLTQSITEVKNFLVETSAMKLSSHLNGFWPNAAVQRDCSSYEHVGVVCGFLIEAYSFQTKRWTYIAPWGMNPMVTVANLNGRLYGLARNQETLELVYFSKNNWSSLLSLNFEMQLFLSHDKCIYIFSSENKITKCQMANEGAFSEAYILETEVFNLSISNAEYAVSFHKNILVFESVRNYRRARTAVHEWNVTNNVWTKVAVLDFNADHMTSFNDDLYLYILDEVGNLYRVEEAETVQVTYIEKIFDIRVKFKGCILFRKCLYVCGEVYGRGDYVSYVENVYTSLEFVDKPLYGQCFVPFLMERSENRFLDVKSC
ncbi:uncharacterized protein LOC106050452 [Biomphalaria glabrata]|uniref:Uncharacterized protein LOC106050452 n=1 Tax=Biomphalaria glabrata TaxID=6526 RepID=A0A9W3BG38_BIOGL|nr:uncharacterized protein LOC106050452 [Biomphalaria glabrata]